MWILTIKCLSGKREMSVCICDVECVYWDAVTMVTVASRE